MSIVRLASPKIEDQYILDEVVDILKSGHFVNGKYNKSFAKQWAQYCNSEYCIPVSSGSAALIACLKSIKKFPQAKNYVIVPTLSFAATVFAVIEAGCIPVYCSVDKNGLLNQENCLEIINSQDTLAVIPVHLYGQYLSIKREILNKVTVIEDACQAHGIKHIQGDAACFSFYPSKNLGTCGDGGAVVTDNADIYDYVSKYINYGDAPGRKYRHSIYGNNLRMGEIEACVLYSKLKRKYLEIEFRQRIEQARHYAKLGITTFANNKENYYHIYPILCDNPDEMIEVFQNEGVEAGRHYPYALFDIAGGDVYYLKGYEDYSYISKMEVSLPIGSHLTLNDIEKVVAILHKHFRLSKGIWINAQT